MTEPPSQLRRSLPVLATLLLATISLAAWQAAERAEEARTRALIQAQADTVVAVAAARVEQLSASLERAALRWAGIDRLSDTLASVESAILLRDPVVARITWLDPDSTVRWAYGPAGPEPIGELQRWVDANDGGWATALSSRSVAIGPLLQDPRQRPVLPISVPVRLAGGIAGVMLVEYDAGTLLRTILPPGGEFVVHVVDEYRRTVLEGGLEGGREDGLENGIEDAAAPTATAELSRPPLRLTVSVTPTAATWARMRSSTPGILLIGGLAFAVLTGLGVRLGQVQGMRARDATMLAALRREIDARVEAEERLAQRATALERSNADLARFAHMISHDLRAPLNVMDMHLQLLAESELREAGERHVEAARGASRRMVDMIDGLLEYARVDTSDGDEPVDTAVAASAALHNLETSIREAEARVRIEDLPTVSGRRQQFVQLFQNLVGNAVRHRGEAAPEVTIGCEAKGRHWLFRVADNGPGIAVAEAERIFGLFEAEGASAGTGVGLAICRRIVEARGGRIWFQSHPGQGTTMLFTWPREAQSGASGGASESSASR